MTTRLRLAVVGLALLLLASCADTEPSAANVPEPWCDDWGLLMLEA